VAISPRWLVTGEAVVGAGDFALQSRARGDGFVVTEVAVQVIGNFVV
jgi:hypothetical protein